MTSGALKQLTISSLRGSTCTFTLPFERGKSLTVVYGENGTGKSTICDAFDLLGSGKVGSIEDRGLGSLQRFWPSAGKATSDIEVTLEGRGGTAWVARARQNGVVVTPASGAPPIEILRRAKILGLVTAPPSARYETIKRFVDVSGVEASEASLRALIRELEGRREVAVARILENDEAISGFWRTAGSQQPDAFTWATDQVAHDQSGFALEIDALNALRDAYVKLVDYPQRLDGASTSAKAAEAAVTAAEGKVTEKLRGVASDAKELVAVLEAAKGYLHQHPSPAVCPVCESSERVQGLQQRIVERLTPFTALQGTQAGTAAAVERSRRAARELETLRGDVLQQIQAFKSAQSSYFWPTDAEMPASPAPDVAEELGGWLASTSHLPKHWQHVIADRTDKKQFADTLKGALNTHTQNVEAQRELDLLLPKLKYALELIEKERRDFTDGILSAIAAEVGRLYEDVHPGEGLNRISLQLDPRRRASLGMAVDFCGVEGVPPQAYFSDSHLDTLGLCIFLALAHMEDAPAKVLVLDDVLGSVDEPHVERVVGMVYRASANFCHTIVTTHYRPWRERFRWGALRPGQPCQFVELGSWDATDGMSYFDSVPEIARLKHLLAAASPDSQAICSKAGVILEYALTYLVQRYECRVPWRQNGAYTIGDLLPSIKNPLRDVLRVDIRDGVTDRSAPAVCVVPLKPILDELTRIAQIRNVMGAHFKAVSFELLDQDAIGFASQVVLLVDALSHPVDGWPNNDDTGSYWRNAADSRRLHPLKKPS